VLDRAAAENKYGSCTTGIERVIPAALRPISVDDVVAIVDIARNHQVPLYPISTGRNWGYGSSNPVVDGCVIVDLSALNSIEVDPELGLATVGPGATQRQLYEYLCDKNLAFLVPVTGAGPDCSLVGNALERGYGITPYADHFAAVTALEAVLPDGRIYRSALSELGGETVNRAFKWGVGPHLDGLFAQSNFGIVTRMTIALAPRPERIEIFIFSMGDDARLEAAVLAVRNILRTVGGVTGSINLMNARRVLAMAEPEAWRRGRPEAPLPPGVVAELARGHGISAWTGLGALYGEAQVVKAARRAIRKILKPVASRVMFHTPVFAAVSRLLQQTPRLRNGRSAKRAAMFDAAQRLSEGEPSEIALPLAYWRAANPQRPNAKMDPARDGCGLIWYPPLVPMTAERVRCYVAMVESVCAKHGLDPLITLTSLSDRCFDSSVPLLFDRRDPRQIAQAQSCYRDLLETGRAEGFIPYRMAVNAMDWVSQPQSPYWDIVERIKTSIDPNGVIAPGRYARFPSLRYEVTELGSPKTLVGG